MRCARPAVGSAVGAAVGASAPAATAGGGSGGELIPNPSFADGGTPWEALEGAPVMFSQDLARWLDAGSAQTPLTGTIQSGAAFSGAIAVSANLNGATMTVQLYSPDLESSQDVYVDAPSIGLVPLSGNASAGRAYFRITSNDAGLRITAVNLALA